jgi:uncharacterized protein (DUF433 family)
MVSTIEHGSLAQLLETKARSCSFVAHACSSIDGHQQTVNLPGNALRRFESSRLHQWNQRLTGRGSQVVAPEVRFAPILLQRHRRRVPEGQDRMKDAPAHPSFPGIVLNPGIQFGHSRIKPRSISTAAIAGRVGAGENVGAVATDYGIPESTVLEAVTYEAWKRRSGRYRKPYRERICNEVCRAYWRELRVAGDLPRGPAVGEIERAWDRRTARWA